jgi:putative drug exporter of the RND superfamily
MKTAMAGATPPTAGPVARAYAGVVVALRWPILAAWAAAAVYVIAVLPEPAQPPDALVSLVPAHARALRANALALHRFRVPLTGETSVVQRDPHGLSARTIAEITALAVRTDRRAQQHPSSSIAAIPVVNASGVVPGSRETGTTAITYLEAPASMPASQREALVDRYRAEAARIGHLAGVTGIYPAEVHEGTLVDEALPLIEAATAALVALLVGVRFRAPGAPLLTLAAVGVAYSVAVQALAHAARRAGLEQPSLLRPLLVALVLGIVTDYAVFYLSTARAKALHGETRLEAARHATAETTPVVLAAGAILAGGLLALELAGVRAFRELGPGLALAVGVAVGVAVTLVPAALAIFGRLLFWPRVPADEARRAAVAARAEPRNWPARLIAHRAAALVVVVVCVAALGLAASRVADLRLGVTAVSGLPASAQERAAASAAADGFQPGMLSPTQAIVTGPGVTVDAAQLAALGSALGRQPGVASVVGPADAPFEHGLGVLTSRSGNAARFLVVYDTDPYGATAIDRASALRARLPALAAAAGLHGVGTAVAGDTIVASDTVAGVRSDLDRVVLAVLGINLVLLVIYLRALIAPILLVAASALSVAAALGITSVVFQSLLGYHELTYFVPFAAGVLLVSLGSDYNVFVAGRVWQEARARPLRDALRIAPARTTAAIRTAGITLATSFGLLAIVDVRAFRELAFAMAVGILLETFLVRPFLVPALISLFGELSGWPGGHLARGRAIAADGD